MIVELVLLLCVDWLLLSIHGNKDWIWRFLQASFFSLSFFSLDTSLFQSCIYSPYSYTFSFKYRDDLYPQFLVWIGRLDNTARCSPIFFILSPFLFVSWGLWWPRLSVSGLNWQFGQMSLCILHSLSFTIFNYTKRWHLEFLLIFPLMFSL